MTAIVAGVLLLAAGLPDAALVRTRAPQLLVEFLADPDTGALCGGAGVLEFELRAPARVTFSIDGQVVIARVDGGTMAPVQAVPLSRGRHAIPFRLAPWPNAPLAVASYLLEAQPETGAPEQARGRVVADTPNRAGLKVGRMFLAGVDLLDGHLIRSAEDVGAPGRHIAVEAGRTYSSASRGLRGLLGAGWSLDWGALVARPECGLYAVIKHGTPQTFRSTDGGRTFRPERGYHTTLGRAADASLEFQDKAGNVHRFTAAPDAWGVHRLAGVREPHGDRIEPAYDAQGRLVEVAEVQVVAAGVRSVPRVLKLGYVQSAGYDRVAWIEAPGLGLRVEYAYDVRGTLAGVRRWDAEAVAPTVESYSYAVADDGGAGEMTAANTPEGTTTYEYWRPRGRPAMVSRVVDRPAGKPQEVTRLAYDLRDAGSGKFRVTIGEGPGATRYVLNGDGSPLIIDEAEGRGRQVTTMTWDTRHVVKLTEQTNRGRTARYGYDERGNLVSAVEIERAGALAQRSSYAYDPRFNKLVFRDRDGRVSRWRLDPATGDLVYAAEAGKAPVTYGYDARGQLVEELEEGGRRTVYAEHDTFGHPTRITHPDGKVTLVEYDVRGRRVADP